MRVGHAAITHQETLSTSIATLATKKQDCSNSVSTTWILATPQHRGAGEKQKFIIIIAKKIMFLHVAGLRLFCQPHSYGLPHQLLLAITIIGFRLRSCAVDYKTDCDHCS